MNSQKNRITDILTICRKAGRLTMGFDATASEIKSGRAALVLYTSDASAKTVKELTFLCSERAAPLIALPLTREDIAESFRKEFAVLAVCDEGFAKKITLLCGDDILQRP